MLDAWLSILLLPELATGNKYFGVGVHKKMKLLRRAISYARNHLMLISIFSLPYITCWPQDCMYRVIIFLLLQFSQDCNIRCTAVRCEASVATKVNEILEGCQPC
jgi:hypothetical protein